MERFEFKAAISVSDEGEIEGTAWPYGAGPDRIGDEITKGAFSSPAQLPMLFGHDRAQLIGVWSAVNETPAGLQVKGRLLVNDVERAREVRALVREGVVTGLSIGFVAKKSAKRKDGGRTISALDLHEVSIVSVPCHPAAQVTSVKGMDMENAETAPAIAALETKVAEIAETVKAFEAKSFNVLRDRLDKIEAKSNRPAGLAEPTNDNLETKAFSTFLRHGLQVLGEERKSLTLAGEAALAPPEFGSELLKNIVLYSPLRAYAKTVTITSNEILYPRRTGITNASWVGETETRTSSDMAFDQVTLVANELATFCDVSNQLLEDNAYNLEGELIANFAEDFGKREGAAFISGDGVKKPYGVLSATGTAVLHTGDANGFPTATNPADVLIALYHAVPQVVASKGIWLMNRQTLQTIRTFKSSMGEYYVLPALKDAAPDTLFGRPIVEMPDMPSIAAGATPIVFMDPSAYRIVDRVNINVKRDDFTQADSGLVRFRSRKRVGGAVTNPDRIVRLVCAA